MLSDYIAYNGVYFISNQNTQNEYGPIIKLPVGVFYGVMKLLLGID